MLYLIKTGCQWRMLPKDFPPYNMLDYYFRKWKNEDVFEANIHDSIGGESVVKVMAGRFPRLKKILAGGGYRGETLSDTVNRNHA